MIWRHQQGLEGPGVGAKNAGIRLVKRGGSMHSGLQLKKADLASSYDAVVVGSGMGGLAAAASLSRAGWKVLVCERHDTAGGFTHTFSRGNYTWDVGVHYIGDVTRQDSRLRRTFDYITKGQLSWQPMDEIYDAIEVDGRTYEFIAGQDHLVRQLYRYFPEDKKGIDRYFQLVAEVSRSSAPFFLQRALPPKVGRFLFSPLSKRFLSYASQTTGAVLDGITKNRTLTRVLTGQWCDYGLPPESSSFAMHAMVASHYFGGASYPSGGAASIAKTIYPVIKESGGEMVVNASVSALDIQRGRLSGVKLANGQHVASQCVISDIGVEKTYQKFVAPHRPIPNDVAAYLKQKNYSMGHVCLYLGLQGDARSLGLKSTNLWLHRAAHADQNFAALSRLLGDEARVVFISFPSVKDPEWPILHPGLSTIEVIAPANFENFRAWQDSSWQKRGQGYVAWKDELAGVLLDIVEAKLPGVRSHVEVAELSTPLSTKHFAGYEHGEIYGLRHDPQRFKQSWLRVDTPIDGLYLTGQDLVTCGVSGALISGVLTAARVLSGRDALRLLRQTLAS